MPRRPEKLRRLLRQREFGSSELRRLRRRLPNACQRRSSMQRERLRGELCGELHGLRQLLRQIGCRHFELWDVWQRLQQARQWLRHVRRRWLRTALQLGLYRLRRRVRRLELCLRSLRHLFERVRRRQGLQIGELRDRLRHPHRLQRFVRGHFQRDLQLRNVRHRLHGTRQWQIGLQRRHVRFSMHCPFYPLRQQLRRHQDRHEQLRWLRHALPKHCQWHRILHQQCMWHGVRFWLLALLRRMCENGQRQRQLRWLWNQMQWQ